MTAIAHTTTSDASRSVTTEQARDQLESVLHHALCHSENSLIDAPTSLGKSHTVATTPWMDYPSVTGGKPVIHLHQTKESRDEAVAKSKQANGVSWRVIKSGVDCCPVAGGEYDDRITAPGGTVPSTWFKRKCHHEGVSFSKAHSYLERTTGGLPCEENGGCEATRRWKNLTNDGKATVDVIHTTATLAHVPWLVDGANIILDERPNFLETFDEEAHERFRRSMNTLLRHRSDSGLTWESLTHAVRSNDVDLLTEFEQAFADDLAETRLFGGDYIHARAPAIGRAMSAGMGRTHERRTGHSGRTSVVLDPMNTIRCVLHQPALETARCVIGLDAFPTKRVWELNTGLSFRSRSVLSDEIRRQWRRDERDLEVRQVGKTANYVTSGWKSSTQKQKANAIIMELHERYGDEFRTAIASKSIDRDVQSLMMEAGINRPETLYYGNLRSRNDFQGEQVGLLLGVIDPGDEYVLDMLALCGLDARPETVEGNRAWGRGYEGPDREAAQEFLDGLRESKLAQGVGRYARNPDAELSGAIVYVWTNVIPHQLVDVVVPGVGASVTGLMRSIEGYIRENSPVTAQQVADGVCVPEDHTSDSVSKKHVLEVFGRLEDQGVVVIRKGEGAYGADLCEYIEGELGRVVDLDAR